MNYSIATNAAEEMQREALEARREVLGERHPNTLNSMSNLAFTLSKQGKYGEAEEIERQMEDL